MDVSFGTVWEAFARELPNATAISDPGRDYSYAEFEERSARLAAALADAGVGPGDKVACYLYNGAAYLETVFAAFKLGAVPVNVNYRYTSEELFALLADADAAAMVFSAELAGNITDVAARLPSLRLLVRVGAGAAVPDAAVPDVTVPDAAVPDAAELGELLAAHAPRPARPRPGSDELFMYTGGTTGKPKGVIWRLSDLMHSMEVSVFQRLGVTALPGTLDEAVRVAAAARSAGRSPVLMPAVPLMHATGLFNSMGALLAGGRVVTARHGRLDPRHVWETVAAQRVRTLVVAGNAVCQPLVDELAAAERAGRPHDLSSLDSVVSSGTVLSDRLKRALHERASVTITDAIASSEGGPFAYAVTYPSTTCRPGSSLPLPRRCWPAQAGGARQRAGRRARLRRPDTARVLQGHAKTTATFRIVDGVATPCQATWRWSSRTAPSGFSAAAPASSTPAARRSTRRKSRTCCSPIPA